MKPKTRAYVTRYLDENFSECSLPLLNGHVYCIVKKIGKVSIYEKKKIFSPTFTLRRLHELSFVFQVSDKAVEGSIRNLIRCFTRLSANIKRDWNKLVEYLNKPFCPQPVKLELNEKNIQDENEIQKEDCDYQPLVTDDVQIKEDTIQTVVDSNEIQQINYDKETEQPNKVKTFSHSLRNVYIENQDCNYCSTRLNSLKAARKRVKILLTTIKEYKEEESYLRKKYKVIKRKESRSRLSAHLWKTKLKQQKALRSDEEIRLSKIVRCQNISISLMKRHHRNVRAEHENLLKQKSDENAELSMELKKYKDKIKELILENHNLICSSMDKTYKN